MPLGQPIITCESTDATVGEVRSALTHVFEAGEAAAEPPDVLLTDAVPRGSASHVILAGPVTDEVDTWDTSVPAQTLAGALWLVPGQPDPATAAVAWVLLRLQTPATPLSDLTDANERALRWSVVAATEVTTPTTEAEAVDDDAVRAWADTRPEVVELGAAVERTGGDNAQAVLASVERLRAALSAFGTPVDLTALDAAVAEHLRQVQRSGFGRWRGGKARAASAAALVDAARTAAGAQVQSLLDRREAALRAESALAAAAGQREALVAAVESALTSLELPAQPDFARVPRSWTTSAPEPRPYVFLPETLADDLPDLPAAVRACPHVPAGTAVCALVQAGFSLPAVR
jgi:hypothetical protein